MNWQTKLTYGALVATCTIGITDPVVAQSWSTNPNNFYQQQYLMEMTMIRIAMMAISIGLGFCIGWFLSPEAKHIRKILFWGAAALMMAVAIFNNGALGWGTAWFVSLVGFFAALGYWLGRGVKAMLEVPTTFGSSQWADGAHMAAKGLFGSDGIILGSAYDDSIDGAVEKVFSYKGDRHLLTSAPTRSGKGVSHIIINLLCYQGSALVIDPKGENARITTKEREAMGQEVMCVDPWGIATSEIGRASARINPLDWIKLGDVDATENAMLLADSLVQQDGKGDAFWLEEAKALLQGLILFVCFDAAFDGRRNLGTVRDLLLLSGDDMIAMFEQMAESPHHLIASTGARSLQKEPKLMANVLASAQAETHMFDSARVRDCLSESDFDFADLKRKPMTVFLILPADRLVTFSRFLRLLVQQAITINARNIADKPKKPVLFILDEMPALGRLTMVEQAYGLMAGFGIQLWGITQDLCQLRRIYGQDYESFIANSGAVAYFGSPDKTSAEYFSAMCGVTTVWNLSSAVATALSSSSGANGGSSSRSTTYTDNRAATQRKLAYPDELMRLREDQQLILIENTNPIMARKLKWYEMPDLRDKGVNLHKA